MQEMKYRIHPYSRGVANECARVHLRVGGQFFHNFSESINSIQIFVFVGAQWLSGRVLDLRLRGRGFESHQEYCVVVLEQDTFILAKYWFNPGRPVLV